MHDAPTGSSVRPLDANERRVLGVLIEKAKTTPDNYPLSLNAVVTGCNQKSNRDPVMMLDEEQVTRALDSLRACGAVAEVYGNGRLARYRHLAYEWLADEREPAKEEVSILGELLLRGAQTEGDLRGRASRMDPIADLTVLREHLDRMAARGLIVWLSPPGRGRVLTHGLLSPEQLTKVKTKLEASGALAAGGPDEPVAPLPAAPLSATAGSTAAEPLPSTPRPPQPVHEQGSAFAERIASLETTVADLQARLSALEAELR